MVTVIIVNWNSGNLLRQCLSDLERQTVAPSRILVIDNGSDDQSALITSEFPRVELHALGNNVGFAAGNNHALEMCDTEFVALLNPDAFPASDWLEKLLDAARNHPQVAAFGSRQMAYQSDQQLDGVGDVYHLSGLVWRRGYGRKLDVSDEEPRKIFSPCAAAALYRTRALVEAGAFDQDYFCYLEDIDLGFRLRLLGYEAMYVPDAVVNHVGSASTGKNSDFSVYHGHRNLVWTYVKNMPGWLFWGCLPLHLAMNIWAIFRFSLQGQGLLMLKAKRDAMAGLPGMWRKRKVIQQRRSASASDLWRIMDKRLWRRLKH